jgi:hypothetical protein
MVGHRGVQDVHLVAHVASVVHRTTLRDRIFDCQSVVSEVLAP